MEQDIKGASPGVHESPSSNSSKTGKRSCWGIWTQIQLLKYKRKAGVILDILKTRSQKDDVEDFVSTMESVIPIINRILNQLHNIEKGDLATILIKLHNCLEAYEENVVKMDSTGTLKRFLTNNRLRKKLEKLNSELHKEIEFFVEIIIQVEVKAAEREQNDNKLVQELPREILERSLNEYGGSSSSFYSRQTSDRSLPGSQGPSAVQLPPGTQETFTLTKEEMAALLQPEAVEDKLDYSWKSRYVNFVPLLLSENTDIFKDPWELAFGLDTQMTDWQSILQFLRKTISINADEELMLKYVLDNSNTGLVSKHKYMEFIKGFGPVEWCLQNLKEIFREHWFYGFLSSKEAEILLCRQPVGTFLFRLSKSAAGSFAVAFTFAPGKVIHILIQSNQPNGYIIMDQETNSQRKFNTLKQIREFYIQVLRTPFTADAPLQSWFQGDITSDEAKELLNGKPVGTFLVRFSSQIGFYAASYIAEDSTIRHVLIEHVNDEQLEGFRVHGENNLFRTMNELVSFYKSVLLHPISKVDKEIGLGYVKELIEKNYDPALSAKRDSTQLSEQTNSSKAEESEASQQQSSNKSEETQPITETATTNATTAATVPTPVTTTESPKTESSEQATDPIAASATKTLATLTGGSATVTSNDDADFDISSNELDELIADLEKEDNTSITFGTNTPPPKRNSLTELAKKATQAQRRSQDYEYVAKLALEDKNHHRFLYLFNDSLALSAHEFSLWTTWIESLSQDFKGGAAFRIISPEKRIIVCANNKQEKEEFLEKVRNQILSLLKKEGYLRDPPDGRKRFAKHTFLSGAYYEGEWEYGVFDGHGMQLLPNGQKYKGNWVKGLRDGEGILLEPNSQKYEGFWKDNQREGFGKQTYVGSSILCYEGNWKQDKRSGSGCAHYVDGSVVKAEWVSDDIVASEKPVTIVFPNGDKYAGECTYAAQLEPLKLQRNGYGVMCYSNGDRYLGCWHHDKRHGSGYFSGDIEYRGEWTEGKMQASTLLVTDKEPTNVSSSGDNPGLATLRRGQPETIDKATSVLRGDMWRPFFSLNKFTTFRKSEIAKAFDEGLNKNPDRSNDRRILGAILACESHPAGSMCSAFALLFNSLYAKIPSLQQMVKPKVMCTDILAFVGCMTSYLSPKYQVLQTEEGTLTIHFAIQDVLFPKIYNTIMDVFITAHQDEALALSQSMSKLKALQSEQLLQVVGVEDKIAKKEPNLMKRLADAAEPLASITFVKSPQEKATCLLNCSKKIESILHATLGTTQIMGADQLLPCICCVLLQSTVPNLIPELSFIENFLEEKYANAVEGYLLTQFQVALKYLREPKGLASRGTVSAPVATQPSTPSTAPKNTTSPYGKVPRDALVQPSTNMTSNTPNNADKSNPNTTARSTSPTLYSSIKPLVTNSSSSSHTQQNSQTTPRERQMSSTNIRALISKFEK